MEYLMYIDCPPKKVQQGDMDTNPDVSLGCRSSDVYCILFVCL